MRFAFISFALVVFLGMASPAKASDVIVNFEGSTPRELTLDIYYHLNLEEKADVKSLKVTDSKQIRLELDNTEQQFYTFMVNSKPRSVLVIPNKVTTLNFDIEKNQWISANNGLEDPIDLFEALNSFKTYDRNFQDSASYTKYHIKFMESLDLDPYNNENSYSRNQTFLRRVCFFNYVSTVQGKSLFSIESGFNSGMNQKIKGWADVKNIKISEASREDFFTIRNYHLFFIFEIFNTHFDGRPSFYELMLVAEKWMDNNGFTEELKSYIMGDMIQWYAKSQYSVDAKFINKLNDLSNSNNHQNLYKSLLAKHSSISDLHFDVEVEDEKGNKFDLSAIEQKLIYVDFWATWCAPCIEEEPYFDSLKEKYDDRIEFLKISIDKEWSSWSSYLAKRKANPHSYIFSNRTSFEKVSEQFGLMAIPKFFLISNSGEIMDLASPRPSDPKIDSYLKEKISQL